MSIKTRVETLERKSGPRVGTTADRLADVLCAGRASGRAINAEQLAAETRRRHIRALEAPPPGQRASELARRLYNAGQRMARAYFETLDRANG